MADRKYPDEIIEELLERLGDGQGLNLICADDHMPARFTVYRWMRGDDELAARVREAREIGYLLRAERILEEIRNCTDPIKARLLFDAERWMLGKLSIGLADKPVALGVQVNVSGGDDSFTAIAGALESIAAARASGRASTFLVDPESSPRPADPAGGLEDLGPVRRQGVREEPDG